MEYARTFLDRGGQVLHTNSLVQIAQNQLGLELSAMQLQCQGMICDTDLLVLAIWSQEVFRSVPCALRALVSHHHYDHTFLCAPDIPWVADPYRSNPMDRDRLYGLYKTELLKSKRPFTEIRGNDPDQRSHQAEIIITNLLKGM